MLIHRKYLWFLMSFFMLAFCMVGCSQEARTPQTSPPIVTTTNIPAATLDATPTHIPLTNTPSAIPSPAASAYWPYPRNNLNNTAAYTLDRWQLIAEPYHLWDIEDEVFIFFNLYPVADDLDGDGHAEYVVARMDPNTLQGFLTVYNVDDGTILWEKPLERDIHWSPPVIADLNNDSQLDLVFATQRQRTPQDAIPQIYALNGRDGTVIWQVEFPEGGLGMTVADVDADGWMEVILNDSGNPRSLYLLNGQDGSIIWQRETCGSQYGQPTAADINGDGLLEIISHHHIMDEGGTNERLIAWDHEGNELWSFESSPTEAQASNAPLELGRTPCESWESTTVADFNGDGQLEIGFGSRCNYYLLDVGGNLIWSTPLNVEGWGYLVFKNDDGSLFQQQSTHGQGGFYRDSAVGNIDEDPALEIVLALYPEFKADQFFPSGRFVYERIEPHNAMWALDGADGSVQWVFEGTYIPELNNLQRMWDPVLVDLNGDSLLDVLILSDDRHLYAVNGATGEKMLEYFSYLPGPWEAIHLTFVPDGDLGVLLFSSVRRGRVNTLNALVIAERVSE